MSVETYIFDQWLAWAVTAPTETPQPEVQAEVRAESNWLEALRQHWPEYLMEAGELGIFMISACLFGTLLEHPSSPVRQAIADANLRRVLMGVAMAATAGSIIYSPWGQRSGAHFNPAVTLTFFRLGKVKTPDAFFYVLAQFLGGLAGVASAAVLLGGLAAHPAVHYVATLPGRWGFGAAFVAEVVITFILMTVILHASNNRKLMRYTGFLAASLVCTYISLEAPVSGMSMNPARSLASAVPPGLWSALWIYFLAPPLGMLLAAELYVRRMGLHHVICAKLHHHNNKRCIFRCGYAAAGGGQL